MALASFVVFFFFFLVVVVEAWSSVEAACGLARADSPDNTNNMPSTIIHVLNLVCILLMISSFTGVIGSRRILLPGAPGKPHGLPSGATIMTLRPRTVNPGFSPERVGRAPSPAAVEVGF